MKKPLIYAIELVDKYNFENHEIPQRRFTTEGKAIDAAMKMARELAGPETTTATRVVVKKGTTRHLREELYSFPISKEAR